MNSDPLSPQSDRGPNPILSGLGVGLLLFSVMLCTVLLFIAPAAGRLLNIAPAPERSWTPPAPAGAPNAVPQLEATPPPALPAPVLQTPATALPASAYPVPAGPLLFKPGDRAVNAAEVPVNLRRTPGYLNKPASDRLTLVPAEAALTIIAGPALVDGLTWWTVRWQDQEGWMAEKRASGGPILAPAR